MPDIIKTFPLLHTPRLSLKEITEEHIPDLFRLFTDERVTEFYGVIPLNKEADAGNIVSMLSRRYQENSGIRWGIFLKEGRGLIGNLGFNSFTPGHRSVIVFSLLPKFWNKGLMTEALRAIISYGFKELKVNRIEAEVMPGNVASEKVLQKLRFRHEGLLQQWMLWDGKYNDINMYALLRSDLDNEY
jgi:[ribosomal protein S5]-alanine N-acetyltransferase